MDGILTGNYHFVAPSYKLKNQDGAECGNTHVHYLRLKLQYSYGWGQSKTKYILTGGDGHNGWGQT